MTYVQLEGTLVLPVLTKVGSTLVPTNATNPPTYVIYDSDLSALMASGSGNTTLAHTFTVSGAADNGSGKVRITTGAAHGLATGQVVTISGITGTTEANGTNPVTVVTSTTFDLEDITFSNAYSAGGTGNVTGLYDMSHSIAAANGFGAGETYFVVFSYVISSTDYVEMVPFTVY